MLRVGKEGKKEGRKDSRFFGLCRLWSLDGDILSFPFFTCLLTFIIVFTCPWFAPLFIPSICFIQCWILVFLMWVPSLSRSGPGLVYNSFEEPMHLGGIRFSQTEQNRRIREKCCLYCGKPFPCYSPSPPPTSHPWPACLHCPPPARLSRSPWAHPVLAGLMTQ